MRPSRLLRREEWGRVLFWCREIEKVGEYRCEVSMDGAHDCF